MAVPPTGGKTGPSPSSRTNKESSRYHYKGYGKRAEWKPTHPLTSEALDGCTPPSPCSEATRARRHKVKMGEV